MAIPTESVSAAAKPSSALPPSQPASTTPTAMPSGRLCSTTASTIIVVRESAALGPSACSLFMCRCGMSLSSSSRNSTPIQKPAAAGKNDHLPRPTACSIAGISRLQTEAATITPAAKPVSARCSVWLI